MSQWEAGTVYGGEDGKPAEIVDVRLDLEGGKDGDPQLILYVELSSKLNNQYRPESGHEAIELAEGEVRFYMGEASKAETRSKIACRQLSKLAGEAVTPDDLLRFAPDHPQSLIPALLGKRAYIVAKQAGTAVYLNLADHLTKPAALSMTEMRKRLEAKREASQIFG